MVELKLSGKQGRFVAAGMAALAGLMVISLFYQVTLHLVWRSWLKEASAVLAVPTTQPAGSQPAGSQPAGSQPAGSQPAGSQPASSPADGKQAGRKESRPVKIASAITRRNIFAPPRPTGHGLTLTGVIGRIALFNSRDGATVGIQEGESEQGVKVVAIRDYEVTIEFKGKKETLKVFDGSGGGGGERMAPPPESVPEIQAAGGPPVRVEIRPATEMPVDSPEAKAARRAIREAARAKQQARQQDGGGS
jgi:hypothetical protein